MLTIESIQQAGHNLIDRLHHYQHDYSSKGGEFMITGLDRPRPVSAHPLAARVLAEV